MFLFVHLENNSQSYKFWAPGIDTVAKLLSIDFEQMARGAVITRNMQLAIGKWHGWVH